MRKALPLTTPQQIDDSAPLVGIRVIEFGNYIAAPYAGRLLAAQGAEVIKVEHPAGDPMRLWESSGNVSTQFVAYNAGKLGVSLDMTRPESTSLAQSLIRSSHIVLTNLRPDVTARFKLDSGSVAEVNPKAIYCAITGFGRNEMYRSRPSYDTVMSALSSITYQLVDPAGPKLRGPAISDLLTGMWATVKILAALQSQAQQSEPIFKDASVSMLEATLLFQAEPLTTSWLTGGNTEATTRQRRAQAYACVASDNLAFIIHLSVPAKFWDGLVDVLGLPALSTDERFVDRESRYQNYDQLLVILQREARRHSRSVWLDLLESRGVPVAPINSANDVWETEGLFDGLEWLEGLLKNKSVPSVGADNQRVFSSLGTSDKELRDFERSGCFG